MRTVLFHYTAFIVLLSIVVLYTYIVNIDKSSTLPSTVGKRNSFADPDAANILDHGDVHFVDVSINDAVLNSTDWNNVKDRIDVKDTLELLDVRSDNSPRNNQRPSEEIQFEDGREDDARPLVALSKQDFKQPTTVVEHRKSTPIASLRSPTKKLDILKHDDPQLVNHDTGRTQSQDLHPQSQSLQQTYSPILDSRSLHQPLGIPKTTLSKSAAALPSRSEPSTKGYVLAINYYEQQSMGSRNLFQLQCWAQHLSLKVVKPVMKDSFLLTPLNQNQQQNLLKFEDSFDLEEWSKQTINSQFAPLVEWSEFISKAPRNVILVQYNYPSVSVLKSRQKAGEPVLQDHIGDRFKTGCGSKWPTSSQLAFLKSNNFQVVRSVCFNFYHGDQLIVKEFDAHLLGENHAENVTIVMDLWRGLGSGQRVLIKDTCTTSFRINEYIKLSDRLLSDATRYIETYLGGLPFVAIMGRLEMTLLTVHKKEPVLPFCLKEIVSELIAYKKDSGINATFLSIDIGRYGSKKWRTKIDIDLQQEFGNFVQNVYSPSTSVSSWERTFEDIATVRDAGYIGLLQKAIVTKARCILFAGGGAFQRHALYHYRLLHPKKEDDCLRVVSSCTSPTKFRL